ncbi:hypothetical protein E6H31_09995 [Candidatus Bathyarchaeota archaeon]|nr:MAG: hypothetical protein E6H31_09995 [Candidatus Bathyarchaeota archaeon]
MRNDIVTDKDPFATPSIQDRLDLIASKLDIISNHQISEQFRYLELRDKKFIEIFEALKTWMHTHDKTLESAKEYFGNKVQKTEEKK